MSYDYPYPPFYYDDDISYWEEMSDDLYYSMLEADDYEEDDYEEDDYEEDDYEEDDYEYDFWDFLDAQDLLEALCTPSEYILPFHEGMCAKDRKGFWEYGDPIPPSDGKCKLRHRNRLRWRKTRKEREKRLWAEHETPVVDPVYFFSELWGKALKL